MSVLNLSFTTIKANKAYPLFIGAGKSNAVRSNSDNQAGSKGEHIANAVRAELPVSRLPGKISETVRRKLGASVDTLEIYYAVHGESWQPGQLNPNLSWTHYRTLRRELRFLAPPEGKTAGKQNLQVAPKSALGKRKKLLP